MAHALNLKGHTWESINVPGKKNKYIKLNGISVDEYLEKARLMFHEMDLQWDLNELDKITSAH